jgi:Arc/MetJ-type ribon-helix-helix transcriptional regulator
MRIDERTGNLDVLVGDGLDFEIKLNREDEQFIQSQIETGRYNHPDEVIDVAFELLKEKKDIDRASARPWST